MADTPNTSRGPERAPENQPQQRKSADSQQVFAPQGRDAIIGTLAEGEETGVDAGSERVSERKEDAREQGGGGGAKKRDEGQKAGGAGTASDDTSGFVFDENHLPPAPKLIEKIEKELRNQIKKLEKEANKYRGGWFKRADYHKYNAAMSEIRERNVLVKRLVSMAYDALKKLYIQMFKPTK